jgi:putative ABC transport system permease protein
MSAELAWRQLSRQPLRLTIAVAGVAFAVILICMQIGFQRALFDSATRVHERLDGDIMLINPQSAYLAMMKPFPRRRLFQALGVRGVESVTPVYAALTHWKNPQTGKTRLIFVLGFDPRSSALQMADVASNLRTLRYPDLVLFDAASRPEYGTVAANFRDGQHVTAEVLNRVITVGGLFTLGTSFGIDGTVITSDLNFQRIFKIRPPGLIDIGLIRLKPGVDPVSVRQQLDTYLPADVEVLTKSEYIAREKQYWDASTPIGFVISFGVVIGMVVGTIIVYQILFADVSDHLPEYATLKAMGYTNRYLCAVVLMEALILAGLGFLPGVVISWQLYRLSEDATQLPMNLNISLAAFVFGLTVVMCALSGLIALRKIRSADPAEIF